MARLHISEAAQPHAPGASRGRGIGMARSYAWPSRTSPTVLNMALTGIAADVPHAGTAPALGLATGLLAVVTAGDPAAGALAR